MYGAGAGVHDRKTIACLVAACLPVTKFLIWFPRWRRKRA
jgi:hypothetical protein